MRVNKWDFESLGLSRTIDSPKHQDTTPLMRNITKSIENFQKINIDELLEEYDLDFGLFTDIDDRLLEIADKWENLTHPEKLLLILYAEFGSLRKVASLFGTSHSTIDKYLKEIRSKLC